MTTNALNLYTGKFRQFTANAWIVLAVNSLTGLVFGVFRLLFNFYVLSLGGYDERFLGLLTSASSIAALAMALPAAQIAGRYSHKWIMVIAGLLNAVAYAGLVLFPIAPVLILCYVLSGLAVTLRQVTTAPFLMRNTGAEERQYVFSFSFGLVTLTESMGYWVGGVMPGWLGGLAGVAATSAPAYRLTLGAISGVSLFSVAPLLFIRRKPRDPADQSNVFQQFGKHGGLILKLVTSPFIIGLGAGLMVPFFNLYFREIFDRSDAAIGTLFMFSALGMGLAQFIAPPIADRLGKINAVVLSQAISIPFLLTMGAAAWAVPALGASVSLWFAIVVVAFLGRNALMNLGGPVYQTFILERVPPEAQALAASLNSLAFTFGWAVSPYISGWLQVTYGDLGFVPIFFTTAALYVLGIVVLWVFFGRRSAVQPAQSLSGQP